MLVQKSDNVYELNKIDAFDLEKQIHIMANAITSGQDKILVLNMARNVLNAAQHTNMCINEQKKKIVSLRNDSVTDNLTETLNHRGFELELSRSHAYAKRHNKHGSMIHVYVNNIKAINKEHSSDAGDAVLCAVTQILKDQIRDIDHVGRVTGNKFTILFNDMPLADAHHRMCALHWALTHTTVNWLGYEIPVTANLTTEAINSTVLKSDSVPNVDNLRERITAHQSPSANKAQYQNIKG